MLNVYLHGNLKEKFGEHFRLDAKSPLEAANALIHLIPGFYSELISANYNVVVGNLDETGLYLKTEDLDLKTQKDVHIVPSVEGSGIDPISWAAAAYAAFKAAAVWAVNTLGWSTIATLAINGISFLLSMQAQKEQQEDEGSPFFTNDAWTARQGGAFPVMYGECYVDLVPVSAELVSGFGVTTTADMQAGALDQAVLDDIFGGNSILKM